MRSIRVELGARAYEVMVGRGLVGRAGELLAGARKGGRAAVVSDDTVAPLYAPALLAALESSGVAASLTTCPAGEQTKSFEVLADLCDRLLAQGTDRKDVVVALGGGVIGDLAGFASAILMRGIDYVQVPTTLLAQVDSSVGGKTAIDSPRGKNLIGAFHQPRLVLADLDVLATLPARQLRAGYGEVLKYGLLGDAVFFAWLEANGAAVLALEPGPLEHAVAHSIAMKAEIVAADERETADRRALLNLGHTFGHALEAEAGYSDALMHGEAVALGCAMAFRFSAAHGLCDQQAARRVEQAVTAAGLPARLDALDLGRVSADGLVERMRGDKKAEGGALTLILARAVGEAFVARDVDPCALRDFLVGEGAQS